MASSTRLKYRIVKCTSEERDYPVSELLSQSQQTKGWQTTKFCEFPQEIGVVFETPVRLRQVQFLSHQSKIATKIELFTALATQGSDYSTASFKRLGYLSLDSNERSQFQARELKSVYVDVSAQFLRILFHKCHANRYNTGNQVGLISLTCHGEGLETAVPSSLPPPTMIRPPSSIVTASPTHAAASPVHAAASPRHPLVASPVASPMRAVASPVHSVVPAQQALLPSPSSSADASKYDPQTQEKVRALEAAKVKAVESEDYEEAKRCKQMIDRIKQSSERLKELEEKKRAAVQNEDYDAAKQIKAEIDRLRNDRGDSPRAPEEPTPREDGGSFRQAPGAAPAASLAPRQAAPAPASRGGPYGGGGYEDEAATPMPGRDLGRSPPGGSARERPQVPSGSPFGRAAQSGPSPGTVRSARPYDSYDDPPETRGDPPPYEGVKSAPPPERFQLQTPTAYGAADVALGIHAEGDAAGGAQNMDEPEPLGSAVADEAQPIVALFGDYVARCIYAKAWNLRDGVLQQLTDQICQGSHGSKDPGQLLRVLTTILRRALADKNVQVFHSGAALLQAVCRRLLGRYHRPEAQAAVEPLLPLLAERLGDGNARAEKTARDAHLDLARCPSIGAHFAVRCLLVPPKKKTVPPRVYSSRLQLLAVLVGEMGIQPGSQEGLPLEPVMGCAMDWFSNPAADVRENVVKLVASCYTLVGLRRIEGHLANLRQTQREVFDAEFEKVSGPPPSVRDHHGGPPQRVQANSHSFAPPPLEPHAVGDEADEDEYVDEFTCQFCGRHDPGFTPEALDVHYWRECPMLLQCQLCEQVIEISRLHSHLSDGECEAGDHARAAARGMAPGQCPLCRAGVGPCTEANWRRHLLEAGCPRNPRA